MKLRNNQEFTGDDTNSLRQITVQANAGTVTLQAVATAKNEADVWVDVPDGLFSTDTNFTMYARPNQRYRCAFTGSPVVWIT